MLSNWKNREHVLFILDIITLKRTLSFLVMHVCECVFVPAAVDILEGQEKALYVLDLELVVVVRGLMWVV